MAFLQFLFGLLVLIGIVIWYIIPIWLLITLCRKWDEHEARKRMEYLKNLKRKQASITAKNKGSVLNIDIKVSEIKLNGEIIYPDNQSVARRPKSNDIISEIIGN